MRKIGSIFEVWETDFRSLRGHFWPLGGQIWPLGGQIWGRRPPIEGLGSPDPRSGPWFWPQGGQNLWSQDRFPYGRANFDLEGGQNPVDLANFGVRDPQKGQFQGSQPGKGSRVLAPNGDRFSIFGPRRIRKSWRSQKCVIPNLTQMWVWKRSFHNPRLKILYLVPSFCLFRSWVSFITKKEGVVSQI